MKILITSDLHGFLPCIEQPADLLLICGDIVPLSVQSNGHKSKVWFRDVFKKWAEELPVDKVIFIARKKVIMKINLINIVPYVNNIFAQDVNAIMKNNIII